MAQVLDFAAAREARQVQAVKPEPKAKKTPHIRRVRIVAFGRVEAKERA